MATANLSRPIDAARIRIWEIAVWVFALAMWFIAPKYAPLFNEIAILALFAVSLDLILGYGGIVSLGHAAFFGTGAYVAALFAKHLMPDPLVGLTIQRAERIQGEKPLPAHAGHSGERRGDYGETRHPGRRDQCAAAMAREEVLGSADARIGLDAAHGDTRRRAHSLRACQSLR